MAISQNSATVNQQMADDTGREAFEDSNFIGWETWRQEGPTSANRKDAYTLTTLYFARLSVISFLLLGFL